MARAVTADPPAILHRSHEPAGAPRPTAATAALEPAIVACEAAIAFRVREGTRPPGRGLLTALVDAVEVGQTVLDLARRQSPLLPAGLVLCRQAFDRARHLCLDRGDAPLVSCAEALAAVVRWLDEPVLTVPSA